MLRGDKRPACLPARAARDWLPLSSPCSGQPYVCWPGENCDTPSTHCFCPKARGSACGVCLQGRRGGQGRAADTRRHATRLAPAPPPTVPPSLPPRLRQDYVCQLPGLTREFGGTCQLDPNRQIEGEFPDGTLSPPDDPQQQAMRDALVRGPGQDGWGPGRRHRCNRQPACMPSSLAAVVCRSDMPADGAQPPQPAGVAGGQLTVGGDAGGAAPGEGRSRGAPRLFGCACLQCDRGSAATSMPPPLAPCAAAAEPQPAAVRPAWRRLGRRALRSCWAAADGKAAAAQVAQRSALLSALHRPAWYSCGHHNCLSRL